MLQYIYELLDMKQPEQQCHHSLSTCLLLRPTYFNECNSHEATQVSDLVAVQARKLFFVFVHVLCSLSSPLDPHFILAVPAKIALIHTLKYLNI